MATSTLPTVELEAIWAAWLAKWVKVRHTCVDMVWQPGTNGPGSADERCHTVISERTSL
jgi:hypothetical protein